MKIWLQQQQPVDQPQQQEEHGEEEEAEDGAHDRHQGAGQERSESPDPAVLRRC